MFGRLGESVGRTRQSIIKQRLRRRRLTVRVGRNSGNLLVGRSTCRRATHAGRFAALRCSYTIVSSRGAAGRRAAAPRNETLAGRASNGPSVAAGASSDPCSKIEFYRMMRKRVDAQIGLQQGFCIERFGNMFHLVSPEFLDRTVGWAPFLHPGHSVEARRRAVGAIIVLSRLTQRTAPPAWLPTTT
jgi:hypothetical protein